MPCDQPDACHDSVDGILADWVRERPDLDFSPVGVITRLGRVRARLDDELSAVFNRYDLSPADFQVIVSLRRAGPPYRLAQARLMGRLALTSGTVSVRIDRLVRRGVVVREPDPADARVALVRLTAAGVAMFDEIAPVHLANEDRLLSALDGAERDQLAGLLRRLLLSFEHDGGRIAADLGLSFVPAHTARARRTGVGLSDPPGLLVTDVRPGGPAGKAGIARGDLLVSAGGRPVLDEVTLRQALMGATGSGVSVEVLRGDERVALVLGSDH